MAEELQHLIDRIQKEAVDTGERQAAQLVSQAKEKAALIVKEAEDKARAILHKAESDSIVYTSRSRDALRQASRDLLITVGQGVENILSNLALQTVEEALTIDVMKEMLVKLADNYIAQADRDRHIDILLNPDDQERLVAFFRDRYQQKLKEGVTIKSDKRITRGFKVSFVEDRIFHDFSSEAIADALVTFLQPKLADIVYHVAREGSGSKENPA